MKHRLDQPHAFKLFSLIDDHNAFFLCAGSVALVNSHSKGLLMASSTFTRSQALFGGAVYADVGAAITISNSSFMGNWAVSVGGAVFCDNCQHLHLEPGTDLSYNAAAGSGGAVYCDGCVLLTAKAVSLTHNQ